MQTVPRLTVVVPCFNEGSRIAVTLATLDSWYGATIEILVMDDGSRDDTCERAEHFAHGHPHVRVHRLARNRGKGAAIREAVPLVRTDEVVFVDADLAFDRGSIDRAVSGLQQAEMVIGNRRHDGSYYTVPVRLFGFLYRRHLAGLLFNAFVRRLAGIRLRDTQCGLKAYRRSCLQKIAPALSIDGFAIDVEILVMAGALNVRPAEVPVQVRYESARSSVSLIVSGWQMASDIVKITMRRARGYYAARAEREH